MNKEERLQSSHYDVEKNQYEFNSILNPPLHTKEEVSLIIEKIKSFIKKGETIIDFGSGAGRLAIPMARENFSILAIDISKASLMTLLKRAKQLGLKIFETRTLIPKNRKFKIIVGTDILHHINLDKYLPNFFKSLEPGGKIIFSEPNALNIAWYIYLPLFQNWTIEKGVMQNTYFNLIKKFEACGFRDIKLTGFGIIPRPLFNFSKKLCRLNDELGNLPIIKFFAYRYIVEATK